MTRDLNARRRFLGRAGAVAASALVPGLVPGIAQAQSGEFVVATFGGLFEKILRTSVIPDFEKARKTAVALQLGVGTTFIPKIVATSLPQLSSSDLKPSKLPLYVTTLYEFPLVYRSEKMAAPTSWSDLWKPGITVGVPHISNSYGLTFLMIAAMLNGGSPSNLGPGFDAIKRLPRFKIYKGVTDGVNMFQQGEVDAGLFYGHRAQQLRDKGMTLASARPKEGVWGQRTGCQIPKASGNPDLARAWIDTTLDVPSQAAFAKELYSPTNRLVKLPPEAMNKNIITAEVLATLKFPPWDVLNPQRDDLLTRWNKEFAS